MITQHIRFIMLTLATAATATFAQTDPFICQPPETIAILTGLNDPTSITIDDEFAYIIEQKHTLVIIDLRDHTAPQLLSRTPIPGNECNGISINADAAYLIHDSSEGFTIFNIADKTDPWFVRYYLTEMNDAQQVPQSPTHIFQQFSAINISRPLAPGIDLYLDPEFEFDSDVVAVHDNTAIIASLEQYDITDPLNPILLETYPFGEVDARTARLEYPYIISPSTSDAIVSLATFNQAIDQITSLQVQPLGFTDATVRGDLLFAANGRIDVYAVSDSPLRVASFGIDDDIVGARLIRRLGDHFVVTGLNYLAIYDIHTNPIGGTRAGSTPSYIELMDDIAIISSSPPLNYTYSTDIINISNPLEPRWIAQLDFMNQNARPQGIATYENHVFVAERTAGLHDFDLSDPENPVLNAIYNTAADPKDSPRARDLKIRNNTAYVVDNANGLLIYQIQNDATLVPIGNLPIDDSCQHITLLDDLAFVCSSSNAYLIQIDDPANPQLLSIIEGIADTNPRMITAHRDGDLLYTADYDAGYRIFDISDPADPIELAHFEADVITPQGEFLAYAYDILVDENLLYLAMSSGGFAIYNNTNPFDPTLITHTPAAVPQGGNNTRYRQFVKRGNQIYMAAGAAGLRILSLDGCTGPCPADLNNDTVLNFFDVSAFIIAFTNEEPRADFNNDGEFDFFDVSDFIVAFSNGCP
ncbi:MAG: GC-type dockerin domain-anchored protein [Phycisphaerales bacterium JB047]